eukprot:TRINITY_DN61_c0_g1_i1.p1 TRINITY_DN61_c0_g1~~TRINITY_DN61_c0_g1_i1.p1  ORF type:complete len:359 (-),score=-0.22 TRINITY_DN61_c0_g1_i1:75-1151(-)
MATTVARNAPFRSKEEEKQGWQSVWRFTFAFADSLAVKCALLLEIPDIIAKSGTNALSLSEIAQQLPTERPHMELLRRVMDYLVAVSFFTANDNGGGERRYGLTAASKHMVKGTPSEGSLRPVFILLNEEVMMAAWHLLHHCVLNGELPFRKAHGMSAFEYAAVHADFNALFNCAMSSASATLIKPFLAAYKHRLSAISSLVDVGGGLGNTLAAIVEECPNITRALNFDLPHVVSTAPQIPGVEHVGGDMFVSVPSAEAILLKWILHDWSDEDCVKILGNCRKAITDDGRVIIVEMVSKEGGERDWNSMVWDLNMRTVSVGGKERTEMEWQKILLESGFQRYNIIPLTEWRSVIEAFP